MTWIACLLCDVFQSPWHSGWAIGTGAPSVGELLGEKKKEKKKTNHVTSWHATVSCVIAYFNPPFFSLSGCVLSLSTRLV